MRILRQALTLLALVAACRASAPAKKPKGSDPPVLHGAVVLGPFPDEAAVCNAVYAGQPECLKRPSDHVAGPTSASDRFGSVEIVDGGFYDDRCAIVFKIADRLYVHDRPGLCLSVGHSVYLPTVREIGFRDLDAMGPDEVVIVADIQIARDEVEGAPPRSTPPIPPLTMAIICGRGGGSPSCVVATTETPDDFVATHKFLF